MIDTIQIVNLNRVPEYIDTVIDWLYSEWGNGNRNYWTSWVKSSLGEDKVPQTFVILVNGVVAGTYSLWRCDLQSRQDLFPWFGGLYVAPHFRGKTYNGTKLGRLLLAHATEQARALRYSCLYLFTEKSPAYYVSNGWEVIGNTFDENDCLVTLCRYQLLC